MNLWYEASFVTLFVLPCHHMYPPASKKRKITIGKRSRFIKRVGFSVLPIPPQEEHVYIFLSWGHKHKSFHKCVLFCMFHPSSSSFFLHLKVSHRQHTFLEKEAKPESELLHSLTSPKYSIKHNCQISSVV